MKIYFYSTVNDEQGLQNTTHELEAKASALFTPERSSIISQIPIYLYLKSMFMSFLTVSSLLRSHGTQASTTRGAYSQVGFSYKGDGRDEAHLMDGDTDDEDDDDDDDDDDDFSSDDSRDEGIDAIAKDFGVKRYNWLLYMDKKAKEEKKQMEVIKGDPGAVRLYYFLLFLNPVIKHLY